MIPTKNVLLCVFSALIPLSFFLLARQAKGEGIFYSRGLDVLLDTTYELDRVKKSNGASNSILRNRIGGGITVRKRGSIFHPGFMTYSGSARFSPFKEFFQTDGSNSSTDGRLLSFSFSTSILSIKPYRANIFANKVQEIVSREFAGKVETNIENYGGTLFLSYDFFPSIFSFKRESFEEESDFDSFGTTKRDMTRDIFEYQGRKQWENSELFLDYEFNDVNDKSLPSLSYDLHQVSVNHKVFFGGKLNRNLSSLFTYYKRLGGNPNSSIRVNENLRIDHSKSLFTDYRYFFVRTQQSRQESTQHFGFFDLHHRLYESLDTSFGVHGSQSTFEGGRVRIYGGDMELAYKKKLPLNGRFIARGGGLYEFEDRDLAEGAVFVFGERHIITEERRFFLDNSDPIVDTIVVLNEDGTTVFQEGVDYEEATLGNLVEIRILLAGSIMVGQVVLVDYQFLTPSTGQISTRGWNSFVGLDFNLIALEYEHREQFQDIISGLFPESFLDEFSIDIFTARLRLEGGSISSLATAEYEIRDSTNLTFRELRLDQFISYRFHGNSLLTVSFRESFGDFETPEKENKLFTGRVNLVHRFSPNLLVNPFGGFRIFKDTLKGSRDTDENAYEAGLRMQFRYGKITIGSELGYSLRQFENLGIQELNFFFKMTRRF